MNATSWNVLADLPSQPDAPVTARRLSTTILLSWGLPNYVEVAELVVSELVTNAVRHTDSERVQLAIQADDEGVRVAVADSSTQPPLLPRLDGQPLPTGGAGLRIVTRLASRWWVEDRPGGKRVWAQLVPEPDVPVI